MTDYLPLKYDGINLARLEEYGRELVANGFEVWVTPTGRNSGYLSYSINGNWGLLQCSEFEGWSHSMPIVPTRENGSAMFLENPLEPFTVEAALQCARPTNTNSVIGTHKNRGKVFRSPDAYQVTA